MATGKKTGGRDFVLGPDPRRKKNPKAGTGIPPDVREALRGLTMMAVETLQRAMESRTLTAASVTAAIHVIERAIGRIPQAIDAKVETGGRIVYEISVVGPQTERAIDAHRDDSDISRET